MSDETDNPEASNAGADSAGPQAGERLLAARREQKIPILEIAKELHLDEYKVRALERNEFDVIGAPVFAKGHLRKYAQLVGVSEDDVMADYHLMDRRHGAPPEISLRSRPRREVSPGPWLVAIAVTAVLAMAYWWLASRPPVVEVVTPAIEAIPSTIEPVADVDEPASGSDDANESETTTTSDVEAPVTEDLPPVADTSPEMRVTVTYSGDCWTEITDANGQRLFFNLGSAGDTINLSGDAPFNVLFGNADNVSLSVDGQPYEIGSTSRRGRTARMTIARPQS